MLREWADKKQLDKIDDALEPPADWRDPNTGLPAGWSGDEDEEWQSFVRATRK